MSSIIIGYKPGYGTTIIRFMRRRPHVVNMTPQIDHNVMIVNARRCMLIERKSDTHLDIETFDTPKGVQGINAGPVVFDEALRLEDLHGGV